MQPAPINYSQNKVNFDLLARAAGFSRLLNLNTILAGSRGGGVDIYMYSGHFGTSHFWVIFAVIQRFSSFRGKNVLP